MMAFRARLGSLLTLAIYVGGCAHVESTREKNPKTVLNSICSVGHQVKKATGSAWLKASSKEASGQFPAQIEVNAPEGSRPNSLRIEAHNLLGATAALITAQGNIFTVEVPGHPEKTQKGSGSWGGIPLEWASDLFLGRIPCPPEGAMSAGTFSGAAELSWTPDGKLVVQTAPILGSEPQKFIYGFKMVDEKAWPEDLHWERTGFAPLSVDFKFSRPEDKTGSPLRWEAKSSLGEIKVLWKEREYE